MYQANRTLPQGRNLEILLEWPLIVVSLPSSCSPRKAPSSPGVYCDQQRRVKNPTDAFQWSSQQPAKSTILRMRPCEGRLNVNPRTFTGVNFKLLLFVLIPTDFSSQRNISPTKMVVATVRGTAPWNLTLRVRPQYTTQGI